MTTLAPFPPRAVDRESQAIPHATCIKTEKRELHAMMVRLVASRYQAVCVWPDRESAKPCCKLPDSKDSWLEAKAGDIILSWDNGKRLWVQRSIAEITLYRVFPVKYCDTIVSSAREWLTNVKGVHKSVFPCVHSRRSCW